jgi:tetratricopeptide (TPR) repeat protein
LFLALLTFTGLLFGWQRSISVDEELRRVQQLVQSGRLEEARTAIRASLARSPTDARLYNFLGVIDAQAKDFASAESNFLRAIQYAPRFVGAYLNLGRLYQEHSGSNKEGTLKALGVYQKLLGLEPDHLEANYQAARLQNRLGAFALSIQHLDRLPATAQSRPQTLVLRVANNAALGKHRETEDAGRELLACTDLSEEDVLPVAAALYKQRPEFHDLATGLLEALARTTPGGQPSAGLLLRLAQLAYKAGNLEKALGYLAHARDLEPANAAVHFFFGMVCVELKLPPEATASLKQAVRLAPGNPNYNYALGAVLVQSKNSDAALPYLRKYKELRPDDPRGRFALAVALFEMSNLDAARQEFQSISHRPETRLGAQLYLGRIAMREENLPQAIKHLEDAGQANQSAAEPRAELGLAYIRRQEFSRAEETLSRAVTLAPDDYLSNLYLLMLYQRTKDPRTEAQSKRVEKLQQAAEERERQLLRTLEIRPY